MNQERHVLKRAEISKMLSSIAGILLAGAFTFVLFALEKSDPSWGFWMVLIVAAASVVLSIVLSGAAIDSDSRLAYNLQALLLGGGFLGFAVLVPLSIPDKREDPGQVIASLLADSLGDSQMQRIAALEVRLSELEMNQQAMKNVSLMACDNENASPTKRVGRPAAARRCTCRKAPDAQAASSEASRM